MLNITDPNSPVNLPNKLKLSNSKASDLLDQSLHNRESDEFVLEYFDPNKVSGLRKLRTKEQRFIFQWHNLCTMILDFKTVQEIFGQLIGQQSNME